MKDFMNALGYPDLSPKRQQLNLLHGRTHIDTSEKSDQDIGWDNIMDFDS